MQTNLPEMSWFLPSSVVIAPGVICSPPSRQLSWLQKVRLERCPIKASQLQKSCPHPFMHRIWLLLYLCASGKMGSQQRGPREMWPEEFNWFKDSRCDKRRRFGCHRCRGKQKKTEHSDVDEGCVDESHVYMSSRQGWKSSYDSKWEPTSVKIEPRTTCIFLTKRGWIASTIDILMNLSFRCTLHMLFRLRMPLVRNDEWKFLGLFSVRLKNKEVVGGVVRTWETRPPLEDGTLFEPGTWRHFCSSQTQYAPSNASADQGLQKIIQHDSGEKQWKKQFPMKELLLIL